MNRNVIFVILGALLILVLMFVLWFWFFGRDKSNILPNNGSFGTGGNQTSVSNANSNDNNGQAPLGGNAGSGVNEGVSNNAPSDTGGYVTFVTSTTSAFSVGLVPSGVSWLGSGSGGSSGTGFTFNQSSINNINNGSVTGAPYIQGGVTGADGSGVSLGSSLAVVIGGCLAQYGLEQLAVKPVIAGTDAVFGAIGSVFANVPILGGLFGGLTGAGQPTSDSNTHVNTATETITQCLARTLGRIAVQKITESTVDWINSGFDGQPAFVQDYNKFFSDTADQAAGAYIQGSDLAFLCSPFKLQVKIAIAQSYANRKSSSASSCSLTDVVGNVEQFMNGDFSQGGWPGFISFTTQPTNNPYGAYISGQIGLYNAQGKALAEAGARISPGGFLAQEQCTGPIDHSTGKNGPPCKIVTPGGALDATVHATFQGQIDSLQLGDSLDQILGALSNALITKVLYNGFANVKPQNVSASTQATGAAGTLMNDMQAGVTSAQQYATVIQRSISDIQNAQQSLASAANCWSLATTTKSLPSAQQAQANAGFSGAVMQINSLEGQVAQQNTKITAANASIVALQSLQTDVLLATTPSDVSSVQSQFNAFKTANNPHFYTSTDITTAQQDRQTLQAAMASVNQSASTQLAQCYALGH